jgi:hypothetical protein
MFQANAGVLAGLALQNRLPSAGFKEFAEAGGLLGYGVDIACRKTSRCSAMTWWSTVCSASRGRGTAGSEDNGRASTLAGRGAVWGRA